MNIFDALPSNFFIIMTSTNKELYYECLKIIYDIYLFLRRGKWIHKLGMVFLSAGACSNIYDRLIREKVIDYIGVKSKCKFLSRLTANFADIYVAVGGVFTVLAKLVDRG